MLKILFLKQHIVSLILFKFVLYWGIRDSILIFVDILWFFYVF